MNVNLTPELEKLVREKVESGMYGSASEVVREALRRMALADRNAGHVAEGPDVHYTERRRGDLGQTMEKIWAEQKARGHVPPSKAEVDAYIDKLRGEWDA